MKIVLLANTDWYLYNFRLPLAEALRTEGHQVVLVSPNGRYAPKLVDRGFEWIEFSMTRRGGNPIGELKTVSRLADLYRSLSPDLVHHFTLKCALYGSVAARLAGVRGIVNAIAGLGYVFSDGGLKARLLKAAVRTFAVVALRGTRVIFQNSEDRDALARACGDRAVVIPGSGVDVERFKPGEGGGGRTVLLASRLLRPKGIGEYVAAATFVRHEMPDARFLLAGEPDEGNPTSISLEEIERWRADGNVEMLGHREDMVEVLNGVDLVVLPSTYGEGVPRILVEAAASGKPLVTTDRPGCRDIVKNGVNGFTIPAHDAGALARAVLRILDDRPLQCAMGRQSRALAVNGFSEKSVIAETIAVYSRAIGADAGSNVRELTTAGAHRR